MATAERTERPPDRTKAEQERLNRQIGGAPQRAPGRDARRPGPVRVPAHGAVPAALPAGLRTSSETVYLVTLVAGGDGHRLLHRAVRLSPRDVRAAREGRTVIRLGTAQFLARARGSGDRDERRGPARDRRRSSAGTPSRSWSSCRRGALLHALVRPRHRPADAPGMSRPGGDPRHRRHARRLQLLPRDRLVPGVPRATTHTLPDVAHPPRDRHGRRPDDRRAARRRGRGARGRRRSAPPRRSATWSSSTRSSRSRARAS